MALNVNSITPAVLKAKDVATLNDLDVAVATLNKIYRQATEPTSGMIAKDLWYDTSDSNASYIYNGSTWDLATAQVDLSEYVEATAIYKTGTTTIDGGRIDTDSLFTQDIAFTGKITGGNDGAYGATGGIVESANYVDGVSGMKIDLVNGSIYIA